MHEGTDPTQPAAQYDSPAGPQPPYFFAVTRDELAELAQGLAEIRAELPALQECIARLQTGRTDRLRVLHRTHYDVRYLVRDIERAASRAHAAALEGFITEPQLAEAFALRAEVRRIDNAWHQAVGLVLLFASTDVVEG